VSGTCFRTHTTQLAINSWAIACLQIAEEEESEALGRCVWKKWSWDGMTCRQSAGHTREIVGKCSAKSESRVPSSWLRSDSPRPCADRWGEMWWSEVHLCANVAPPGRGWGCSCHVLGGTDKPVYSLFLGTSTAAPLREEMTMARHARIETRDQQRAL
jgi:hypothetical protein